MRYPLLFCGLFTMLVGAAAYFYKNTAEQKQAAQTMVLSSLCANQSALFQYKIRDNQRTIDNNIKANPKYKARRKALDLLETAYANYKVSIAACRVGTTYEPTMDSGVLYQKGSQEDIEQYMAARNILKKYYQDSLLQNSFFYTDKKNWICLDSTHEAAMRYFYQNYTKYSPEQQYTWIDGDRLYWQQNFERFTGYVTEDMTEKAAAWSQYIEKKQEFCTVMSPNELCNTTKKPFEASISIVALNNSKNLKYVLNGQFIKSKNGRALFKMPSGAASDDLKTMVMTATITNPTTGESTPAKGEQQYRVFK